jgi:hypothetical protein
VFLFIYILCFNRNLSLGTFVYVALVEILLEEFDEKHTDRSHAYEVIIVEKEDRLKHISKHKKFIAAILGNFWIVGNSFSLLGSATAILLSSSLGDNH